MKINLLNKLFILLLFLLTAFPLVAQVTSDVDLYTQKLSIEKDLKKGIESIISTRLERETFEVGVSASVSEVENKSKKPEAKKRSDEYFPEDLSLGIIDIDKVLASYEQDIKLLEENDKATSKKYQISDLEILIGLHQKYGNEYFKQFEEWISAYSRANYFSNAKVRVFKIKEAVIEKEEAPKTDGFDKRNLYEKLKDFQWLIGGMIAILLFFLIAMLRDFLRAKRELKQKKMELQHLSDLEDKKKQNELQVEDDTDDEELEEDLARETNVEEQYQQYTMKITYLLMNLGDRVETLINHWMTEDREGKEKLALLLDSVQNTMLSNNKENQESLRGFLLKLSNYYAPYLQDLQDSFDDVLDIDLDEHVEILRDIYWEVLKLNSLGIESIKQPFDFLKGVKKQELELIMNGQDLQTRSLVLLHMTKNQQKDYIDGLDYSEVKDIVYTSLQNKDLDSEVLEDVETAVKVVTSSIEAADIGQKINLLPKTVKVLEALTSSKEIKVLRELKQENKVDITSLGAVFLTFSFVDRWKSQSLELISKRFSTEEITTLIRIVPEAKEKILEVAPERVRQIVSDNLQMDAIESDHQIDQAVTSMKKKLYQAMKTENMALKDLYTEKQELQNVA